MGRGGISFVWRGYEEADRRVWDDFVGRAYNGHFFFRRSYLDYHGSRLIDRSLILARRGSVIALLPAHLEGETLVSHGGLTYGGMIVGGDVRVPELGEIFELLLESLREMGVETLAYRPMPSLYHRVPWQGDLGILHRMGARLISRKIAHAVSLQHPSRINRGRVCRLNEARRERVRCGPIEDHAEAWDLVERTLALRHGVGTLHSREEILALRERFPDRITWRGAWHRGELTAVYVLFENCGVARFQYVGHASDGFSADALLAHLIEWYRARGFRLLELGTSEDPGSGELQDGLIRYKESFGATPVVYDGYTIAVAR